MEKEYLALSGIQHYSFCKRQWALIHIEQIWSENVLTASGRVEHKRAHDDLVEKRKGILVIHGLRIKSEVMRIDGVCDVVEFLPDKDGVNLHGHDGTWMPYPVEYKHGKSKADDCDRLQLTAQVMCIEEMLCCTINEAALYYVGTHHREKVCITQELREKVIAITNEMWDYFNRGHTPKCKGGKQCQKCSLIDLCMPGLFSDKTKFSVDQYIRDHIEDSRNDK